MVRRMLLQMRVIERVGALSPLPGPDAAFSPGGLLLLLLHRKWPFEGKSWCSSSLREARQLGQDARAGESLAG